jgi:RND family efflux transporter MFP subunit
MVRELRLPATLAADEQVDLLAKTSGYVATIDVDIGSRVQAGQVLVKLSVPEMADELHQAEAVLRARQAKVRALQAQAVRAQRMVETAQAQVRQYDARHELDQLNLDRKQELHEGNAIPQQELDEALGAHAIAEAQLQIAQAQVAGAQAEKAAVDADIEVAQSDVMVARADLARLQTLMDYALVRAPFDGVITVRKVDHGTFVRSAAEGSTTPLLRVAKTDRIRIVLEIPETDARYVRVGTVVNINVKALGMEPFPGAVSRTAGALKPDTRTMRAEVDLDNGDHRLAPGMYAQVVVELESKARAMLIPSKAIRMRGKDTIVLVTANGVAADRLVEIGYDDGIWAEVLSGLDGTELVITSTSGAVGAGAIVEPVHGGSS